MWHDPQVTSSPASAQHLRDLTRLRRVRDRIDREYEQPLDVEALARGAHIGLVPGGGGQGMTSPVTDPDGNVPGLIQDR